MKNYIKIIRPLLILLLFIFIFSGCNFGKKDNKNSQDQSQENDLLLSMSFQIPDWTESKFRILDKADKIADYLKGEAELYFAYGLKKAIVKNFRNKRKLPMLLEIYELDRSESAYGLYSFDSIGKKESIGQEASYDHGLLRFWKDNFFVKVVAYEDYIDLEKDIFAFAKAVDSQIPSTGQKPQLVNMIPEKGIVPDSLTFFYKNVCLNNIYYLPESTALFLPEKVEAVTALYTLGSGEPLRLILLKYLEEIEASVAYGKFGELYYMGDFILGMRENVIKLEAGKYDAIALRLSYVIVVFEAPNMDIAKKVVEATTLRLSPIRPEDNDNEKK